MGHICITDHGTREVKMGGYSSFLSVYGPTRSRGQ